MISGASFILTLNILISNLCKLRFLQEVLQPLNYRPFHECDLYGYLIFDCETSKQMEHKKIEMLRKH